MRDKIVWAVTALLGLAFVGVGLYLDFDYLLHHKDPMNIQVPALFTILAVLGALMINPTPIVTGVKQVIVVILPALPWGRRPPPDGDVK